MSASREQEFRLGAERGDTPLLPGERVWGFWGFAYANSALAVATWVFLIGGATALFVGPLQGIAAIIIGNIIGVVLAASSTCLPCGKYGVEQFTFLRSMFGLNGSRLVYFLSVVVLTMGWLAVLGLMCGRALDNLQTLVQQRQPGADGWLVTAGALLAIVLAALVAMRGPEMIRRLSAVIAPSLILIMLALMYFISRRYSLDELLAMPPLQPPFENPHVNFMVAVEINIAAGFSWWPYIGNLSRLCSNQRTAFWPNLVGIFGAASLGESVSLFAATTLGSSDPTAWMRLAGGMGFGIIALSFLALANLTGMVNILYTAVIGLRQLAGERLRSVGWGVLIALFCIIPVVIVVLLPGIYDGFFIFLVWTSALKQRPGRYRHRRLLLPAQAAPEPAAYLRRTERVALALLQRLQPHRTGGAGGGLCGLRGGVQPANPGPYRLLHLRHGLATVLPAGRAGALRPDPTAGSAPGLGRLPKA